MRNEWVDRHAHIQAQCRCSACCYTGHCTSRATTQDGSRQAGDIQQALISLAVLAANQPGAATSKLAKAALQAGATAAAMQAATALVAAGLPQGRAVQDIVCPAKAPRLTAADWLWLSVALLCCAQSFHRFALRLCQPMHGVLQQYTQQNFHPGAMLWSCITFGLWYKSLSHSSCGSCNAKDPMLRGSHKSQLMS